MIRARLFLMATACLAGLTPALRAGGYPSYGYRSYGYSSYPSYAYSQPYYYPYAYTYYPPGNYQPGYYNNQYSSGGYYPTGTVVYGSAYQAPTYQAPAATTYSADWKKALLDVQKARDEHAAYLQATKALGYSAPLPSPYGGPAPLPPAPPVGPNYGYATPNLGPYGVNGATTYGVTVQQQQSTYGQQPVWSVDLMQLFQSQDRATQRAQDYGKDAVGALAQNIALAAQSAAGLAEIDRRAKGLTYAADALLRVSAGLQPSPSSVTTTTTTAAGAQAGAGNGTQPAPQPQPQAAPAGQDNDLAMRAFREQTVPACAKCHSGGAGQKGKFLIASYPELSQEQQNKVLRKVASNAPDDMMPPQGEPRLSRDGHAALVYLRKEK
jgi:hypothetical protein